MQTAASRPGAATTRRRVRVLVAKPGLDGHDRGAKVVAQALRDAGVEVVYTGLRQTPESIARAALDEDLDAICLSILSGAHLRIAARLQAVLGELGIDDVPVVVGGIIPEEDVGELEAYGVRAVFGPGASLADITRTVRDLAGAWR